jgi:hypothetical protein
VAEDKGTNFGGWKGRVEAEEGSEVGEVGEVVRAWMSRPRTISSLRISFDAVAMTRFLH